MKKTFLLSKIIFVLLFYLLVSCSVQNEISKDDFRTISRNTSVLFYDKVDSIKVNYDNQVLTSSFLKDFTEMNRVNYSKPIQLDFKKNQLFLKFEDTSKKKYVLIFYGKLYKKKFVFYTNYETISFPILFITKNVTRYSIYLPSTNDILIKKTNVNEGMLLLFGAGNTSSNSYKFKILKNE